MSPKGIPTGWQNRECENSLVLYRDISFWRIITHAQCNMLCRMIYLRKTVRPLDDTDGIRILENFFSTDESKYFLILYTVEVKMVQPIGTRARLIRDGMSTFFWDGVSVVIRIGGTSDHSSYQWLEEYSYESRLPCSEFSWEENPISPCKGKISPRKPFSHRIEWHTL